MEHEHYTSEYPARPKPYKCRGCGKTFERDIRGMLCIPCQTKGQARRAELLKKCGSAAEGKESLQEERAKNRERRREI